jgi:hypothetical protein
MSPSSETSDVEHFEVPIAAVAGASDAVGFYTLETVAIYFKIL